MIEARFPKPADSSGYRQIAPTDISQFIRLEQCQRYLRLRLHERAFGSGFMRDADVTPQSIPPLLTRSGARFERAAEARIRELLPASNLATETTRTAAWTDDNARVIAEARSLPAGSTLALFQPRLRVEIEGWLIRGDIDVLRLERDAAGSLNVLIADMKSTTSAKLEHRLQVAFYHDMLASLFRDAGVDCDRITMGVVYRGPTVANETPTDEEAAIVARQRDAAERLLNVSDGLLEIVADPEHYLGAVHELVTSANSTAQQVARLSFEEIPYHLSYKCDGCLYNEFCMKWSAERDDLSVLPHLTAQDKGALQRHGIMTTQDLATLKTSKPGQPESLVPRPGKEALSAALATTWPVGPRLDELVHRARRYRRWKKDSIAAISYIPSKGYGSLPYADANHNPNLVRVYIDAQHDYLHDRVYLLGALLVGCEGGVERPERRRTIVRMAEGPPDTPEREETLLVDWIAEVTRALSEVAAPDETGAPRAPIHLIFFNSFEQRLLLDALARHATKILGATPLYDFITQLAAFDSPVATFLDQEIRDHKNYPMVCQSLQAVAAYLGFDWNQPEGYRQLFRPRLFDFWGKLDRNDDASDWYTNRSRFNSQIPLEFAYATWGDLGPPAEGETDDYARYRGVSLDQIAGFQARRLEAIEHVARDFAGNRQTLKSTFNIPDLETFEEKADSLAGALREFVTIERHVDLAAWKTARLASPERRVLAGNTLLVRYREEDQEPGVAEQNRENQRRSQLREAYRAAWKAANPGAAQVRLPSDQRAESEWSQQGMRFWLRLEMTGVGCGIDEALGLTTFREGDRLLLYPRWTTDSRLPENERTPFTPTPKQMLYGQRVELKQVVVERDTTGRARSARLLVETLGPTHGGRPGFVFGGRDEPLVTGQIYTLDSDPNDWYAAFQAGVVDELVAGSANTLHERLVTPAAARAHWPEAAAAAQARFLDGLDALCAAGALHDFEESKRAFIGANGAEPILLVQGPPGSGKSYSTAFALFARLQGAMASGLPMRVFLTCKMHAATDVLLDNVRAVQSMIADWHAGHPDLCRQFFDPRLQDVPLFRVRPRETPIEPIIGLPAKRDAPKGAPGAADRIIAEEWCVVAATPAGTRGVINDRWSRELFGHDFCHTLVLDEASQMNLPEAIMAALPLKPDGQLIVVGDHRQMPPIVKHDWAHEPRRTFQEYRAYESLFETLGPLDLPTIRFAESFRLHADMAEFLRREIYRHDGIAFHSRKTALLPEGSHADPFVAALLAPQHPIVVVVHDEQGSQLRNPFEQALIAPALEALARLGPHGLDAIEGLGVVVPHRAQRAALREGIPCLTILDDDTGAVIVSAVDTVERFQGDERVAILVSATESDPQYLLVSSKFLLDPRRLTVALSRAKSKMILVAARSVFNVFSSDEETFTNAQLWKNLLRHTCTVPLWQGERDGHSVEVWGNAARAANDER